MVQTADERDAHRIARLILCLYAVCALVVGTWGIEAPWFPAEARALVGGLLAGFCLFAAAWPSSHRYRWAFGAVFAFGMWSAVRVLLSDYSSATALVGATLYATIGGTALGAGGMVAVLDGILTAADKQGGDEQ